ATLLLIAKEALSWYDKAAARSNADAKARIAKLLRGEQSAPPTDESTQQQAIEDTKSTRLAVLAHDKLRLEANDDLDKAPPPELSEREMEEIMATTGATKAAESAVDSTDTEEEVLGKPVRFQAAALGLPIQRLEEGVMKQIKPLTPKVPPMPDPQIPARPPMAAGIKTRWTRQKESVADLSLSHIERVLKDAQQMLHRTGVISCQEASANSLMLHGLRELDAEGALKVNMYTHIVYAPDWIAEEGTESLHNLIDNAATFKSTMLIPALSR
ncbi:hypothetical protein LTR72_011790, partial [Exophiala xenobiotica]